VLTLAGAPGALDGEWLVVEATHRFSEGEGGTWTRVVAQPKDVPYRALPTTPRPVVVGHDTAFVAAPDGSETETIHTDEHGRVKVRFRWDRSGRSFDDASAWMRVAQLQTAGSQVLPRVGWEVVVEYLEGDPDRPVVTGRLYNGAIPPPYALPEGRTRTSLQSASTPGGDGRNEIRLEDAAGKEEVAISAQKNQTIVVANDSTESTVSNSKKEIGANLTLTVGGDETIRITSGVKSGAASEDLSVGGSRDVKVDAVMGLSASGAIETSIGGDLSAQIGSPLKGLLDLAGEVVMEAVEAKVKEAAAQIEGKAKAAVDQLLGSVGDLASKAGAAGAAAESGDLGAALGAAAGLPSPGSLAAGLGMDEGLAGLAEAAMEKVGKAEAAEAGGGGGESQANEAGPDGALPANAAAQGACGPGHAILHALATLDESVGGSKVTLAAGKVTTAVGGARTISVGAARVELTAGDRVESCTSKTETEAGRVILASGAIAEATAASRSTKVGGAILEQVGGNATVQAGGNLALVGAFWKVTAKGAIVLECGGSKVTIAGGGIEISTPALTLTAPTIKFPKSGTEK
jgi:type VI secretion system secreted protein VgrG